MNNKNYLFLMVLLMPYITHAEVYKWVDENGTTHYSATKPANANATTVKFQPQPKSLKTPEELLQEKEQRRRVEVEKEIALKKASTEPAQHSQPKSLSGGVEDGSDVSRCNLAQDILNGALRHSNGKPIDAYDIKTATNDVKKFCH